MRLLRLLVPTSTCSFPILHVCDGTHMNRMIFFDLTKMLCIYCIISLEGFGDSYSAIERHLGGSR